MKIYFIIVIVIILKYVPINLQAQEMNEVNVLNYYAVGNSLDGQPLIKTRNILRFFPVFAFRENTEKVTVAVYYGKDPFITEADKKDKGRYWEANLPKFDFGESIQRLEVETTVKLDDKIHNRFIQIRDSIAKYEKESYHDYIGDLKKIKDDLQSKAAILNDRVNKLIKDIDTIENYNKSSELFNKLKAINEIIDSIKKCNPDIDSIKIKTQIDSLKSFLTNLTGAFNNCSEVTKNDLKYIKESIKELEDNLQKRIFDEITTEFENRGFALFHLEDSLKNSFIDKVTKQFTENKLAGPQLTESDIKFDDNHEYVTMLYRNYKQTLRQLQALDPAEKMGIFRVRYVPFAVTGNKLTKPFTSKTSAVFEVGLGFGNINISGDDFVKPTLSFDRLGVAFAITDKLFNDDAEILALVFTYDFNYYGSIGVGANFRKDNEKNKIESYFSFGINKTAFERLLVELGKFLGIKNN